MLKNVGNTDRIIRSVAAVVMLLMILTGAVDGVAAIVLGVVAVVLLVTSALSSCPIYWALKLSTLAGRRKEK